jgi:hypothetical protein
MFVKKDAQKMYLELGHVEGSSYRGLKLCNQILCHVCWKKKR